MNISNKSTDLIIHFETLRLTAYDDLQPHLILNQNSVLKGTLTIGYGHTSNVYIGQKITKEQAFELLKEDLLNSQNSINSLVTVPLNQNQFDALVSFVYNIGHTAFKKSTLLKKLNNNDYLGASNEFKRWNKAKGQILDGLIDRRLKEKNLFLNGIGVLNYEKKN